jgi:uncharacterized repeat protein (TIGR03803 family)
MAFSILAASWASENSHSKREEERREIMRSRKQEMTHDARRGATLETGWWRRVGILCLFLAVTAIASSAKHVPLFTNLANFDGTDGPWVLGNLAQGTDGNLYGVTLFGGDFNGVVFSVTPTGTLAVLHYFCQTDCADGANPGSGVVLGSDGNFYGTTVSGGAYGAGTVFKITPSGTLTTLYNWCAQPNCADGYDAIAPYAPLVQAIDGNFYGTTSAGRGQWLRHRLQDHSGGRIYLALQLLLPTELR